MSPERTTVSTVGMQSPEYTQQYWLMIAMLAKLDVPSPVPGDSGSSTTQPMLAIPSLAGDSDVIPSCT